MTYRIGSLCSGYEGLGLGVQAVLGGDIAWVSDIDAGANKILAYRYPEVPNLGDFTTVDWSRVEPVDVLTAGFPCQPVSGAGRRQGINDKRWLFDDIVRALGVLRPRPRMCVFENVLGLLSANGGDAMARVVQGLASVGYVGSWRTVRASDIGAPHRRERVFITAWDTHGPGLEGRRLGGGGAGERAPGPSGGERLLPSPRTSDTNGAGQHGDGGLDLRTAVTLLPTPACNDMGEGKTPQAWDEWTAKMQAAHGNGNGYGKSLAIEAQRLLPTPRSQNGEPRNQNIWERPADQPQNLENALAHALTEWGVYADAIARWEHVLGRPAPPPTQPSRKGTPQLSPAFSEWLMGLPAGWVTDVPGITRNEALRALGNGVVPQQAAAALRFLLSVSEATA